MKRCIPTTSLVPDKGFRQGHLISHRKQILGVDLEMDSLVTVEGSGTHRHRPVIVLKLNGDANAPHQTKVGTIVGFAFLDEKIGVISYENEDITFPVSEKRGTATVHLHLLSTFDLP